MEDLKNIVKEIITYKNLGLSHLSDDAILDVSARIFISNNISEDKKEKSEESKVKKASEKQLKFLKQLGYKGDQDLTVREAFELINKLLKK